ncbi:hypothetical protein MXB_1767 [Myxobolus squamalis]|nr:hypothetical protein MXB_1767 [Myxobolus squamalis]
MLGNKSPINPTTTILPLMLVVFITSAKHAFEDYNRHNSDNVVNRKKTILLQNGEFVPSFAQYIKIGDIVKVCDDEEFPCDIVLLASSNPDAKCYLTTVNFDGETNLKLRHCVPGIGRVIDPAEIEEYSFSVECDKPNHELYKFNGKFTLMSNITSPKDISLSLENFLLRGAQLKNTDFVIGVAVYTGHETKMAQNQQKKRTKVSIVDQKLNEFILFMILILILGSTVITIMHYAVVKTHSLWYLDSSFLIVSGLSIFVNIASFVALLNHLIPISLYITLGFNRRFLLIEMQKLWNSFFIDWDLEMYHSYTDDPARSNSSDTIEELGQIEYIFTDKTGTLTENKMKFKKCVIDNIVYKKRSHHIESNMLFGVENMPEKALEFFTFICICHSAEAQIREPLFPGQPAFYKYISPSADEVSLLDAANSFKILHILDFDAKRKRMSVIFQNEEKEYFLVCKGADSHVLPLSISTEIRDILATRIDKFAAEGLRTLAFGYKMMTQQEYNDVDSAICNAQMTIVDREDEIEKACKLVEDNLILIGATAVDDRISTGAHEYALIFDGATLKFVLENHKEDMSYLFSKLKTVLCSRMSPLQKSEAVRFVRKFVPGKPITLGIGDGANDCSMIQEAHVGIGVMGQEGRQAVYSSDFAIHRFRYLRKLLLFHGFNFYSRIANTILYFFYKNFIMSFPTFLFVWYTNFSPTSLYEDAELTMYNPLLTSMPVLIYGIFEQPYLKQTLMNRPEIYHFLAINCDILLYFTYNLFGTMVYTYVVLCATVQIQLMTRFWTLHAVVTTVGSIIYYIIGASFISLLYSFDYTSEVFSSKFQSYYVFFNMLSYPHFWCGIVIILPIAFFPYLIFSFVMQFKTLQKVNRMKFKFFVKEMVPTDENGIQHYDRLLYYSSHQAKYFE